MGWIIDTRRTVGLGVLMQQSSYKEILYSQQKEIDKTIVWKNRFTPAITLCYGFRF